MKSKLVKNIFSWNPSDSMMSAMFTLSILLFSFWAIFVPLGYFFLIGLIFSIKKPHFQSRLFNLCHLSKPILVALVFSGLLLIVIPSKILVIKTYEFNSLEYYLAFVLGGMTLYLLGICTTLIYQRIMGTLNSKKTLI